METVTADIRLDGRLTVRTRPADDGPWPGIVMLHEIWGIDDVMRRLADRLAGLGYLVPCPTCSAKGPGCAVSEGLSEHSRTEPGSRSS